MKFRKLSQAFILEKQTNKLAKFSKGQSHAVSLYVSLMFHPLEELVFWTLHPWSFLFCSNG